jgi:hypothetical protein
MLYLLLAFLISTVKAEPTALLVSGGDYPGSNYCDFYTDIERANSLLNGWKKINLVADGDIPNGPPNSVSCIPKDKTLVRKQITEKTDGKASLSELKKQIQSLTKLKPGEPVLLYFTDHGGRKISDGKTEYSLMLWSEDLKQNELQKIIVEFKEAHPANPLIFIHDHCFSGGMMENFRNPETGEAIPGVCGFAASSPEEYSFTGESFMNKAKSILLHDTKKKTTFANVFYQLKYSDDISSTPVSTSEAFLSNAYNRHMLILKNDDKCREQIGVSDQKLKKYILKNHLNEKAIDLFNQLRIKSNTSLDHLEKIWQEKLKLFEDTEKLKKEADDKFDDLKGKWAVSETEHVYGISALNEFLLNEDRHKPISISGGGQKSWEELNTFFRNTFKNATIDNVAFKNFAQEGGAEGKWSTDILTKPNELSEQMAPLEKTARKYKKLVDVVRQINAFKYLTQNELAQYSQLLECENTIIKNPGAKK